MTENDSQEDTDLDDAVFMNIREKSDKMNEINRKRREEMEQNMIQYLKFEDNVTSKKPNPRCCDNCTGNYEGLNEQGLYDFTKDIRTFLKVVQTMDGRFGLDMYISYIRGTNTEISDYFKAHPLNGSGKDKSQDWWKAVGRLLEREKYLKENEHNNSTFSVSRKARELLSNINKGNIQIMLQPPPEMLLSMSVLIVKEIVNERDADTSRSLPSTSRKSLSSKHSLQLLKVPNKSTLQSDSESEFSYIVKEEDTKVYQLLMSKRTEIASRLNCTPYMVASDEALMKMAKMKPFTIEEFRWFQLEGFTEDKIKWFGEEFVNIIREICEFEPLTLEDKNARSIMDILAENPLPGAKIGAVAEVSFSIYKSGLTVHEIAKKRGLIPDTILSHLIDGIKVGYPIQVIDLDVTDDIRDVIINIIRNPPINSDMKDPNKIKSLCPPNITIDDVRIVIAYLQVRNHLQKLNVKYEDFESHTNGNTSSNLSSAQQKQTEKRDADNLQNSSTKSTKKQKIRHTSSTETENDGDDESDFIDSPPGPSRPRTSRHYTCFKCSKPYKYKHGLIRHVKYECDKKPQFRCPICKRIFQRNDTMLKHMRNVHKQENAAFSCPKCGNKYVHKYSLHRHMDFECDEIGKFTCPFCDCVCKRNDLLQRHIRRYHKTQIGD